MLAAGAATAGKLVIYPLLAWLLLGPLLGLELFWVQAGVMLAAMPTATDAFVLAQRFHTGADEVSAVVLLSTVIASLAFPMTAWLLHRRRAGAVMAGVGGAGRFSVTCADPSLSVGKKCA